MQQKNSHKTLMILHYAIIMGVLGFGLVVFYLSKGAKVSFENDGTFFILAPTFALLAFVFHNMIFKKTINKVLQDNTVKRTLGHFQSSHIIRLAILEGAALLNIVATFMTENLLFLMIAAFLLLVMLYHKPTKDKIKTELQLSEQEAAKLFEGVN